MYLQAIHSMSFVLQNSFRLIKPSSRICCVWMNTSTSSNYASLRKFQTSTGSLIEENELHSRGDDRSARSKNVLKYFNQTSLTGDVCTDPVSIVNDNTGETYGYKFDILTRRNHMQTARPPSNVEEEHAVVCFNKTLFPMIQKFVRVNQRVMVQGVLDYYTFPWSGKNEGSRECQVRVKSLEVLKTDLND